MNALALLALALPAAAPPLTVDSIRAEAQALVRVQSTLEWYVRTVGETPLRAQTYQGHERLFSPEAIATVAAALKNPKLSLWAWSVVVSVSKMTALSGVGRKNLLPLPVRVAFKRFA